ncbi:hypothetical protein N7478_011190 [Penicillium angulare]|uniref:uncharacterized protein n=1 Tax=Penicillium angulare TaxID=116970 RepID=UPI0025402F8A|nr:uncharacterized protein N7478_011190 [Penicillium angulare]KAJ5263585.1 hypothetical protein N7478_011190 [Penicillium angulare]
MAAAKALLDLSHSTLLQATSDQNSYALGEIASLPAGVYGTTPATSVATDMLSTYKGHTKPSGSDSWLESVVFMTTGRQWMEDGSNVQA